MHQDRPWAMPAHRRHGRPGGPRSVSGPTGVETISTLADAEQQIVSAARDLAYLAGELGRVTRGERAARRGAARGARRVRCA